MKEESERASSANPPVPKPLVIQTEELDPAPAAWLREHAELVQCSHSEFPRFDQLLKQAEGLVVRTYTRVNLELLAKAPHLKVVGRAGVGLDNIDIAACRARGIEVVHTPGANTRAVVEFVNALICDAVRPRAYLDRAIPAADWITLRRELNAPRQLCEMTLGIYGMGRIGTQIARLGAALDMRVLYTDLLDVPEAVRAGARPVVPDQLLRESDIVSVHVDERPSNRHLLNATAFSKVKSEVLLINTSRGFVVDHSALATFLKSNPAAQAMLDVHDPEPIEASHPLLGLPNARLSPHIASATDAAKRQMSWVVRDVWRVLNGQQPEFPARS
jgi:phosphoglycerate dehydrogenase-like enzyme